MRRNSTFYVFFQGGGGSGPPVPPLDPRMDSMRYKVFVFFLVFFQIYFNWVDTKVHRNHATVLPGLT